MIAFAVFGPIAAIAIAGYAITWRLCEPDRGRHVRPQPLPPKRRRIRDWAARKWDSWWHGRLSAPRPLVRLREARYQLAWAHSSPVRPGTLRALPPLPTEDERTLVWVSDLAHPMRRVRAWSWTVAALVRRLADAPAAVAQPEPESAYPDWPTGDFKALVLDGER